MSDVYNGPSAYVDADEAAHLGIVPGHYALEPSGKALLRKGLRRKPVRLVMVDDAPGNDRDGACHLEVAKKGDPIAKAGRIVGLEFHGEGKATVRP